MHRGAFMIGVDGFSGAHLSLFGGHHSLGRGDYSGIKEDQLEGWGSGGKN